MVKKFSGHSEMFFLIFYQKTGIDISCNLSPKESICMNCQNLFSRKNQKSMVSLSPAELTQSVVKVEVEDILV